MATAGRSSVSSPRRPGPPGPPGPPWGGFHPLGPPGAPGPSLPIWLPSRHAAHLTRCADTPGANPAALDLMGANSPSDHEDDLQCQHEEPPGNSNATNSSTIAHAVLRVASLRCYPPTGSTTAASTPLDVATSGSSDAPSSSTALPPSGALIYLHQLKARSRHANRKPLNRFALQGARLLMPPPTDADTVHDWQQRIEDHLSRTWQLLDRGSGSTTMLDSTTHLSGKTHRFER